MKTKIFLTLILSLFLSALTAQVPVGFNYQAIARDASGNILANQSLPIKIDIQTSMTGGTLIYEEIFPLVSSNQFGLINFVVGTGTSTGQGTVSSFALIDWKAQPLYLKTIVQYPGTTWTTMGTSQIFSVPYSLVAKDVQGPLSKLGITGTTDNMEEALFEVRNKAGNTVFAVYNEGVRAYVGNGDAKGIRGGFAVGGYDDTKGIHDLMWVTSDSVRVYVDNVPGNKGIRGGFAVGGYDMTKGGTLSKYLNIETESLATVDPAQNRILWYPLKNAFMTGKVLIQKGDTVGENSFASGYESKAIGDYSQALGFQSYARGNYSTSIGMNSETKKDYSFALGVQTKATGAASYAFGSGAKATGQLSFALGSIGFDVNSQPTGPTIASGDAAFAIGFGSVASGMGSFTYGILNKAIGPFSQAMGNGTTTKAWTSTTTGLWTLVEPRGVNAMANGYLTKAGNWAACAFGDQTYAYGHTSFATGYTTYAKGQLTATFGDQTIAQAYGSVAIGKCNLAWGDTTIWTDTDPVFMIGNGTSNTARSNAVTIYKNGKGEFAGALDLNHGKTGFNSALSAQGAQAIWYGDLGSGYYFSWGYGGTYNVFAHKVSVGTTDYPGGYSLYVAGSAYSSGTWTGSDMRWKKNILDLGNVIDKLVLLNGVSYDWRKDEFPEKNFDDGKQLGLIAQDVEKIFPDLVKTDGQGYKAVAYDKLSVLLLQGLKEQQQQIRSQQEQIDQLRKQLDELLSRPGK